jgi:primary-amine oxidase
VDLSRHRSPAAVAAVEATQSGRGCATIRGVLRRTSVAVVILALSIACQHGSASSRDTRGSAAARHPLDPLTADEIRLAVQVAKSDARFAAAAFPSIALQDPPKAEVLAWQPDKADKPMGRLARVQAMTAAGFYELLVDVDGRRLVSAAERRGVEPSITLSEIEGTAVVLSNEAFKNALRKRGITDLAKVFCAPFSAGYYGGPEQAGKRLVKVGCFDTRQSTTNVFGWPIERLYALVDLRRMAVLSVTDYGVVPIADGNLNYDAAAIRTPREARRPTLLAQPGGSNVRIAGHEVSWGNWRFHVRVDPRVGTAISMARWRDGSTWRSVLYQGYLSEMFVPYMDPDYGWQSRTYFDTGEYGAGVLASTLKPGIDCPETASFLPADFASDKGEPFTTPYAMCIFERSGGDPIWRHYEAVNQTYEGRPNVQLVVRMAAAIGNYDYLFDWIFNDAAEIEVRVGATGIDALKGVASRRMDDPTAADDTHYGTLVAPNLVATNHDHYFNFRLDLDVDGPTNSVNRDVYRPVKLPADSARRSIYVVDRQIAGTETSATVDTHHDPVRLRVINERRTNSVGNPASYEVLALNHAQLMLDPDDWPARRAAFLRHDAWVTPYEADERYAGGQYVLGSHGDDGLAVWASRNRPIRNTDVVVWVNLGMHHLTRAEDLPVTPTMWQSFTLRPNNFFDRNPAIDLPAATATR